MMHELRASNQPATTTVPVWAAASALSLGQSQPWHPPDSACSAARPAPLMDEPSPAHCLPVALELGVQAARAAAMRQDVGRARAQSPVPSAEGAAKVVGNLVMQAPPALLGLAASGRRVPGPAPASAVHPVWALLIGSHAQVCGSSGSSRAVAVRRHSERSEGAPSFVRAFRKNEHSAPAKLAQERPSVQAACCQPSLELLLHTAALPQPHHPALVQRTAAASKRSAGPEGERAEAESCMGLERMPVLQEPEHGERQQAPAGGSHPTPQGPADLQPASPWDNGWELTAALQPGSAPRQRLQQAAEVAAVAMAMPMGPPTAEWGLWARAL
mmetsp:Transcript_17455/g.41436  ORF Transcript_17455/g.41436 Transcript_17455/m.41436 type:complete len:329 (-) Transcript_17455:1004-1990(-)